MGHRAYLSEALPPCVLSFSPPQLYAPPQHVVRHTTLHQVMNCSRPLYRTGAMQDPASELRRIPLPKLFGK